MGKVTSRREKIKKSDFAPLFGKLAPKHWYGSRAAGGTSLTNPNLRHSPTPSSKVECPNPNMNVQDSRLQLSLRFEYNFIYRLSKLMKTALPRKFHPYQLYHLTPTVPSDSDFQVLRIERSLIAVVKFTGNREVSFIFQWPKIVTGVNQDSIAILILLYIYFF